MSYLIWIRTRVTIGFTQFDVAFNEQIHNIGKFEGLEKRVSDNRSAGVAGIICLLESTEQLRFQDAASFIGELQHVGRGFVSRQTIAHLENVTNENVITNVHLIYTSYL